MFRQVAGDDNKELIKTVEIGDLSMWTNKEAINDLDKVLLTEELYCTPERGRARAWLLAKAPGFRVYLSIVGPKSEKFKGDFPLTSSQSDNILKAVTDLVETLKKEPRGQHPAG